MNDPPALRAAGLDPRAVGCRLARVVADRALRNGFEHGDPPAGNVYVRALPLAPPLLAAGGAGGLRRGENGGGNAGDGSCAGAGTGTGAGVVGGLRRPQLVLMDHGLYHTLAVGPRRDLCRLYLACVRRDRAAAATLSARFAGAAVARFFPLLLSPWFVLGAGAGMAELRAAREGRLPAGVSLSDIGNFLVGLHGKVRPFPLRCPALSRPPFFRMASTGICLPGLHDKVRSGWVLFLSPPWFNSRVIWP